MSCGLKEYTDANIIDIENKYTIPGLFDLHVHFKDISIMKGGVEKVVKSGQLVKD